jgi:hypothetical protein
MAKKHGLDFIEVSALSSSNITEAFNLICKRILKKQDIKPKTILKIPKTHLSGKKK